MAGTDVEDPGTCPSNPAHGRLVYHPPGTPEQAYVGASYVCPEPGCWSSVLIMSTALLADLASIQHTPEPKEQ
jgi:hypothetical protein